MEHFGENYVSNDDEFYYDAAPLYTDQVFNSHEELINWAKQTAMSLGIVLVSKRSNKNAVGDFTRTVLKCDRGGVYTGKGVESSRATGTRKTNCPFQMEGFFADGWGWRVFVKDHTHNHQLGVFLEGHPYARRMSQAEKEYVERSAKLNLPPRDILVNLKQEFPDNLSIRKDIYNIIAQMKHREAEQVGSTPMQVLMGMLHARNYTYDFTKDDISNRLENLFFIHPKSFEIFRAFPHVVFIDATYKTNVYNMPFVQIVGVTSTGKTFCIACAFVTDEKGVTYEWVLDCLRKTLWPGMVVRVICTDKEQALINACIEVFPNAGRILCRFHIIQNLEKHCQKYFKKKIDWDGFMHRWSVVVQSRTPDAYLINKQKLAEYVKRFSGSIFPYLEHTWLNQACEESIVSCWVDEYPNFANYTTNRVESEHSLLKIHLKGKVNMPQFLEAIEQIVGAQVTSIKESFERCRINIIHKHNVHWLRLLHGNVSNKALEILVAEHKRLNQFNGDISRCGCKVLRSCGLPCACRLSLYLRKGKCIPLEAIHVFWKKLDFSPLVDEIKQEDVLETQEDDMSIDEEMDSLKQAIIKQPETVRRSWLRKIKDMINPRKTSMKPSAVQLQTRGRPSTKKKRDKPLPDLNLTPGRHSSYQPPSTFQRSSSMHTNWVHDDTNKATGRHSSYQEPWSIARSNSAVSYAFEQGASSSLYPTYSETPVWETPKDDTQRYLAHIPECLQEYVARIVDVYGDGNCGFRALAVAMEMNEDNYYEWVREEMVQEYESKQSFYDDMFRKEDHILESLRVSKTPRPIRDWMQIPDAGVLIANRFGYVVHCINLRESTTVFPFFLSQEKAVPHRFISIANVGGNHYVMVELKNNYPMPPITMFWAQHRSPVASGWEEMYRERLDHYIELVRKPPVYADITSDSSQFFWNPFDGY